MKQIHFARAIKVLRASRGLSQGELARAAAIAPSYLCLLENGGRQPSDRTVEALSRALKVPDGLLKVLAADKRDFGGLPKSEVARIGQLLLDIVLGLDSPPPVVLREPR